ncbi:MAG: MFS transporter [Desulfobacterales bacterium]|jgi:MFS family permease
MSELNPVPAAKSEENNVTPMQAGTFYGWWIVLAGTAVLFVSSGIGFYGHGVILDPLRTAHGWSKATISSAVTLYFLTAGIMGMLIGRQIDKYGPKGVLIFGSIAIGSGFFFLSLVAAVWQLYAIYLLMAIGFSCTSLVPVNTLITNWFIRKRGFAMSLTNTGLSAGGIVLVPFASYLISDWGLKITLPILGATFWVVIIPTAIFFIKQRPSDLHQFPDGSPPETLSPDKSARSHSQAAQLRVWSRTQALHTAAFWSIVVAFLLALSGQIAFLVHQVSFLSQYLGISGAARAVSVTAAASIVGRLFLGTFVDRCDKRYVIMVCFLIQAIAVITLAYYSEAVILYLSTFAFGLTMGSIIMLQSLIIGECFGRVSFATVSGVAGLFTMSGAAFGPTIAGFIYDATQSYRVAFTIFAALSTIAIFVILFAKPPRGAGG